MVLLLSTVQLSRASLVSRRRKVEIDIRLLSQRRFYRTDPHARGGVGRSWRIIQLMPNLSRTWPKREAKNSSRIGIKTLPPLERAEKARSASPSLSIRSVR